MAGRLAWLVVVAVAAPGCLLVDPIDQQPAIDIRLDTPGVIHRGQAIQLEAIGHDPEGQSIYYHWQALACAVAPGDCDAAPFFTGTQPSAAFAAPKLRADGTPAQAVFVRLDGTDSGGATAQPAQQLVIALEDQPPTVEVSPPTATLVRGTSLPVFATVADPTTMPAPCSSRGTCSRRTAPRPTRSAITPARCRRARSARCSRPPTTTRASARGTSARPRPIRSR